jgi:hypothetical protein
MAVFGYKDGHNNMSFWKSFFGSVKIFLLFVLVCAFAYGIFSISGFTLQDFGIRFGADNVTVDGSQEKPITLSLDRSPNLVFVSQTEYEIGDGTGSTIVKLTDYKADKIDTVCWEQIMYPNKSIYIDWLPMVQQLNYSNYYMDFPIPSVVGIYDQEVRCEVSNKNISIGKGFHVGNLTPKLEELRQANMVAMS